MAEKVRRKTAKGKKATARRSASAEKARLKGTGQRKTTRKAPMQPVSSKPYLQWSEWEAAYEISNGLESGLLQTVRESLDLTNSQLSEVVQISTRTLGRRQHEDKLPPDESERVYRIARLVELATDVLGSQDHAREWFKEPNFALAEKTPLELANTGPGASIVKRLLEQIRHGVGV